MKCPHCQSTNIVAGELELKKSLGNFFLFAFGAYHLFFDTDSGYSSMVLRARRGMPAQQCMECDTLIARPRAGD